MNEGDLIPYEAAEVQANRLLVLAAHPDDDVFGAGGLIARLAPRAEAVRAVVFTGGEAQQGGEPDSADPAVRRREALEAGRILGVGDYVFLDFPDRSLEERRRDVRDRVRAEIARFRPDAVLAPSPCEIHPDHRALAAALYEAVAGTRPGDADFDAFRLVRLLFFEVTQPILPNILVPLGQLADVKRSAVEKFVSQAAVRDYAGAVRGLNVFRSLTLSHSGPVEAFRAISSRDVRARSLEEFRREIGPGAVAGPSEAAGEIGVVVRTRNRPALVVEAIESLARQRVRPGRVIVVNDGGAPLGASLGRFGKHFDLEIAENEQGRGRAAAANAGADLARTPLLAFLDDDDVLMPDHFERLLASRRAGPEPIHYSDAVTVVLERDGEGWREEHRELQFSADFDRDLLLYANYIPLHTVLFDGALFRRAGGFDASLDYSEDWDLLVRLSFEAPFRHVRAVTAHYRVFPGEAGHEEAGSEAFRAARRRILERYRDRRDDDTTVRVLDRLTERLFESERREYVAAGELAFLRASHRRVAQELEAAGRELEARGVRLLAAENGAAADRAHFSRRAAEYETEVADLKTEVARLSALIREMEGTRAWRLHRAVHILRGRG
jgi:LmbE family N-acetylglucosaminyl deacetylase/glycosyltransferase involved in cell wall biosynthesis